MHADFHSRPEVVLAAAVVISSLYGAPVWAADIFDCSAALKAANPYNTGKVGMSGNGWIFGWEQPKLVTSRGDLKKDGWNAEVRSEVQIGDKLRAIVNLSAWGSNNGKSTRQVSYRVRWIAPRDIKLPNGQTSRCVEESAITLEVGRQVTHDLGLDDPDIENAVGVWQFFAYDLKGNPLILLSYELQKTKTKNELAEEFLARNFRDYMDIGKCLSMNLTPLSKNEYLQAITTIDKAAKAQGLDTGAIWQKTGAEHKEALDTWDRHVAGYTGLGWEQRKLLREVCASTSALLMQASKVASGGGSAPQKDF